MGACASKPWEIDLRDICQGLRCFSHVVKDKLLFILQTVLKSKTLKKMSKKTYDPRLVWPYSLLLCGPTGCRKLLGLLIYLKELRKHLMVIYFVVLRNLVLMKSVIAQTFYLVNIHLSCISFNLFCFVYSLVPFKDPLGSAKIRSRIDRIR